VVTLHEFSIFRFYRWPWFAPFAYAAAGCVFTSAAERDVFMRRMPGMRARNTIIPIGSNIPRGAPTIRDPRSVCYFGLLMPGKGLEAFLDLAELLHAKSGGWRAILIGAAASGSEAYARGIVDRAASLQVAVHIGLAARDIANLLQGITYAYLPGPGGITERRGAVLAALENGVKVVGPMGEAAPDWLLACVLAAVSPAQAADQLTRPRASPPADAGTRVPNSASWQSIAEQHTALYEKIARRVLQHA
jgi:glycosyltransferase involved in cell wall biosynthesis